MNKYRLRTSNNGHLYYAIQKIKKVDKIAKVFHAEPAAINFIVDENMKIEKRHKNNTPK